MVIGIAKELVSRGYQVVILTRGYKSGLDHQDYAVLLDGEVQANPSGKDFAADEARMQSANLKTVPIVIGADRVHGAYSYLEKNPSPHFWILDDGFPALSYPKTVGYSPFGFELPIR